MDKSKTLKTKEPYIGSVRFFKNLILLFVIILIAVPTVFAFVFWNQSKALADDLQEQQAQMTLAQEQEEQEEQLQAEAMPYQELYPDFYVQEPMPEQTSEKDVMYLTFDDGPSDHTDQILSILKEKDVKATFFVVTQGGEWDVQMMKQIVADGHTLGMHSYSHDYTKIYSSVEEFLADYYQLFTLIRDEVGVTPTVFRFPGGSLNAYNQGVYEEIVAEMLRRGFVYYDWNLSAQDAASVPPSKGEILQSILGYSDNKSRGIVLMHDTNACKTTLEALPELIDGLRNQGFHFDRIDRSVKPIFFSYMIQKE